LSSEYNRAATATIVPLYLCPSTSRTHRSRTGGRIGDRNGDGVIDVSLFEGMACIDYTGNAGVNSTSSGGRPRYMLPDGVTGYPNDNGVISNTAVTSLDKGTPMQSITDGLSKTILLFELTGRGVNVASGSTPSSGDNPRGAWAAGLNCAALGPNDLTVPLVNPATTAASDGLYAWTNIPNNSLFSDHRGGANVAMCDGSVHFVAESTADAILIGLASRNCGEIAGVGQ
jgi:prepilin-type processing-associated H-X9-DG protein